mmetsp:Transcript_12190/g.40491  ORF Transcript_12190/g.40491 Transcript_12190/m.40491 type:complete len:253 (+) Transcript_12190:1681-2439(+)
MATDLPGVRIGVVTRCLLVGKSPAMSLSFGGLPTTSRPVVETAEVPAASESRRASRRKDSSSLFATLVSVVVGDVPGAFIDFSGDVSDPLADGLTSELSDSSLKASSSGEYLLGSFVPKLASRASALRDAINAAAASASRNSPSLMDARLRDCLRTAGFRFLDVKAPGRDISAFSRAVASHSRTAAFPASCTFVSNSEGVKSLANGVVPPLGPPFPNPPTVASIRASMFRSKSSRPALDVLPGTYCPGTYCG